MVFLSILQVETLKNSVHHFKYSFFISIIRYCPGNFSKNIKFNSSNIIIHFTSRVDSISHIPRKNPFEQNLS